MESQDYILKSRVTVKNNRKISNERSLCFVYDFRTKGDNLALNRKRWHDEGQIDLIEKILWINNQDSQNPNPRTMYTKLTR